MARPVLLDSCAAIWLINGDAMSADSRVAIDAEGRGGKRHGQLVPLRVDQRAGGLATPPFTPERRPPFRGAGAPSRSSIDPASLTGVAADPRDGGWLKDCHQVRFYRLGQ